MSEPMFKAKITLTLEDFMHAKKLSGRMRPLFRGLFILICALCVVASVSIIRDILIGIEVTFTAYAILVVTLVFPIDFYYFRPKKWKKTFTQSKVYEEPYELCFYADHVQSISKNHDSTTGWSSYVKWKSDSKITLLYFTNELFQMVPRNGFNSDEEYQKFKEFVREKLGKPHLNMG